MVCSLLLSTEGGIGSKFHLQRLQHRAKGYQQHFRARYLYKICFSTAKNQITIKNFGSFVSGKFFKEETPLEALHLPKFPGFDSSSPQTLTLIWYFQHASATALSRSCQNWLRVKPMMAMPTERSRQDFLG